MKKGKFFLAFLSGSIACLILFASLVSANQIQSQTNNTVTDKKFYFDKEIRPDHVLYPLSAATDQIELMLSPTQQQRVDSIINNAQKRLEYAKSLSEDNNDLAVSVLAKSLHYALDLFDDEAVLMRSSIKNKEKIIKFCDLHIQNSEELIEQNNMFEEKAISDLLISLRTKTQVLMN